MTLAYVGIGTNLGERERHLEFALGALEALPDTELVRRSRIYESRAVGPGTQGHYLNAVAEVSTHAGAETLLAALLEIETRAGRVRRERWGPRTLDLDLLLYGGETIRQPGLIVPHPRMTQRNFVMEPLADLVPDREIGLRSARDYANFLHDNNTLWVFAK